MSALGVEAVDPRHEAAPIDALQQFLSFVIADEVYAIPIGTVAEIIGLQRITRVPDPRPHVKGVINLRGTVIPVIDVRIRLGMRPIEAGARTCIVVVALEEMLVGLLVDTIAGVVDVMAGEIEAAPRRRASTLAESIVTGFVHTEGGVRILIDLAGLLVGAGAGAESGAEESASAGSARA